MDSLLADNLPAVGAAGLLLVLLAAFGAYRLVRRRRAEAPETSFLESRLKPDSFFGASGGQHVDTREVPPGASTSSMMNYSLSQLDAIGDVDAVAEADVYLAYGRDLQAEEILREALRTTPDRLAIRTKLLEVYAKRRDVKGFEQLALELFAITEGAGPDWAQAQAMGRELDPENALYRSEGASAADVGTARAAAHEPPGNSVLPTIPMAAPQGALRDMSAGEPPLSTSFDLDLDLDLGMDEVPPPAPPAAYVPPPGDMLAFVEPAGYGALAPNPAPAAPSQAAAPVPVEKPSSLGTGAFSLDLDLPEPMNLSSGSPSMLPPIEGYEAAPDSGPASDFGADDLGDADAADPLARKLELAVEFRQIGDLEGARDLLQEVVDRADGALKAKAEGMLARLQ